MKAVKKTSEYTVYQRRDNRYAVIGSDRKAINGDEKIKILLAEDLIKVAAPKVVEEETPAEDTAATEEGNEETPAAE